MKNYRYVERRNRMIRNIGLWVGEVIFMILLAYLLVHYCVQIIAVHGESMQPSYYDNDMANVSAYTRDRYLGKVGDFEGVYGGADHGMV